MHSSPSKRISTAAHRQDPSHGSKNRRKAKRWLFCQSEIAIAVEHVAGGNSRFLVSARNLSTGGMAFLHNGFLHKGSHCRLLLRRNDGAIVPLNGEIVGCRHSVGMTHEIGVKFEHPIDVAEFVSDAAPPKLSQEPSVRLTTVVGQVLYIDDCQEECDLMAFILQACGARVNTANGGIDGLSMVESGQFIGVITELRLPSISGVEVVAALKEMKFPGAIIGVTADERPEIAAAAKAAGCHEVLVKPVNAEQLAIVLQKFSKGAPKAGSSPNTLISDKWNESSMRPLIIRFVNHLQEKVSQVAAALQANEWESAEEFALKLKGSAAGHGFPSLAELAAQLVSCCQKQNAEKIGQIVSELESLQRCAAFAIEQQADFASTEQSQ